MACLEGPTYHSDVARGLNENRQGLPTYSGSAAGLHEWKFQGLTKVRALEQIEDEQIWNTKLVEVARSLLAVVLGMGEAQLHSRYDGEGIDEAILR